MQNLPRPLSIILFILRAVFTSKLGVGSLFAILLGVLWRAVALWETADFLGGRGRMDQLEVVFESVWGPIALVIVGLIGLYRVVTVRLRESQADAPPSAATYERQNANAGLAAKREAAKKLLEDAFGQGQNLQKGMYCHGERLRSANQEDVERWVDRTYDFIHDAFGRPVAQRFLSREGYTDEELYEGKLPPGWQPRFLNDKYFVKARLKRLDELRRAVPEISPSFSPDNYSWDWIRR